MNSSGSTPSTAYAPTTSSTDVSAPIPRWLRVSAVALIVPLLGEIAFLVVAFALAGPEENLAGVLLIIAAVIAVPTLLAILLWGLGLALSTRHPRAALILVVASVVISGLTALSQVALWLPSL